MTMAPVLSYLILITLVGCCWMANVNATSKADAASSPTESTTINIITTSKTPQDDASNSEESNSQQQQQCKEGDDTCKVRIVTIEELATKKGENGEKELWLSILGKVYDVSAGHDFYGPGRSYHIFAGRDATVPFISGQFTEEEASKHTDELSVEQLYSLDKEWGEFYAGGNEGRYRFVGFLCCRYFTEEGLPTAETIRVQERIDSYKDIKEQLDAERKAKREARKKQRAEDKKKKEEEEKKKKQK